MLVGGTRVSRSMRVEGDGWWYGAQYGPGVVREYKDGEGIDFGDTHKLKHSFFTLTSPTQQAINILERWLEARFGYTVSEIMLKDRVPGDNEEIRSRLLVTRNLFRRGISTPQKKTFYVLTNGHVTPDPFLQY